jgi:glycosyltransferase involved in cell wall biosynthesis
LAAPTRLVFCITELDPGGAERAMTQLVLSLNRQEWEPHVICLGPRGYFADVLESANVPVVCLNASGVCSVPRVLFKLTRELRRRRPALVQTFLFHANVLGRIAARFAGIPRIVSGLRVAEHRSPWYGRIDRWTNFLVTTNVCVSQGVADFSAEQEGLSRDKLVVIPNAVDLERFAQASPADVTPFGIPAASRILISIGRLERQKGIDVLLDAIEQLDPLPDDVHFLIVGDGPDAPQLRQRVEEMRLTDRIHFVGRRDDVPGLLAASMALVLPSRWEGMPNVVLEAMAAGRPVIASRVEGIAELVRDHASGLTFNSENSRELSIAIKTILSDSAFAAQAGIESQSIVSQYFTVDSITARYENLYRQILSRS